MRAEISTLGCLHCGLPTVGTSRFCCAGCARVHELLLENGLEKFYEMRTLRTGKSAAPIGETRQNFQFLSDSDRKQMDFYIEGIHCLGCLWVLEKLPALLPGVDSARLDLSSSVLHVRIDARTNFQIVAEWIEKLGYRPRAISHNNAMHWQTRENRALLVRLGVAGVCAGNIMLLAVSVYAGASGGLAEYFGWLSLGLSLPVVFFSALPLYKSAWLALRGRYISVDLPIALAIWAGMATSIHSLVHGQQEIYFDSLSTLVFLILASRYFLRRIQQSHLKDERLLEFLSTKLFSRLRNGKIESIAAEEIRPGDRLRIAMNEMIPADGILRCEKMSIDLSMITGESLPVSALAGDVVYAGSKNLGADADIEVTRIGKSSRLGHILEQLKGERTSATEFMQFADRASQWLIAIVLIFAALTLIAFHSNPEEGIRRALALVIVTCPCILAFAIPLSLTLCSRIAAQNGIFIKNPMSLEKMHSLQRIFLDKTGTLTEGNFEVLQWVEDSRYSEEIRAAVQALESNSRHPAAKSILRHLDRLHGASGNKPQTTGARVREIAGWGVEGVFGGAEWKICKSARLSSRNRNSIEVWRNNNIVARIELGDRLRADSLATIQKLKGYTLHILSGDRWLPALETALALGIPEKNVMADMGPEAKAQIIASHSHSLMIGDGANDALALKKAFCSIAVHGGMELSLKNAEIFFSKPGLQSLVDLLAIAHSYRKIVIRNLCFTLFYNVIAGTAAIAGAMNPLLAAIIMPLSAASVFFSTYIIRTRELRALGFPARKEAKI